MRSHLYSLNCQSAHLAATWLSVTDGFSLHYGWAVGPNGRAQHTWLQNDDGKVLDLFEWIDHEDLGKCDVYARESTVKYLMSEGFWP